MDFIAAMRTLQAGRPVTRPQWNQHQKRCLVYEIIPEQIVEIGRPCGAVMYSASQQDLLAKDWEISQ